MVELSVQHNRITAHNADLSARFGDLHADIVVDKTGRVQVLAERMRFYSDVDAIGKDVLEAIEDLLNKDKDLAIRFRKLKAKIHRHLV